jgi:methyltransferase-like protein 6
VIWPAADVLCRYIISNPHEFQNKTMLEVGSGVGICGLLAAQLASKCILTDNNDIIIDILQKNANIFNEDTQKTLPPLPSSSSSNNNRVEVAFLHWGEDSQIDALLQKFPNGFDIVIGSDVCYWPSCINPLFKTLDRLLSQTPSSSSSRPSFVLAYQSRALSCDRLVLETAKSYGFEVTDLYPAFTASTKTTRDEIEGAYLPLDYSARFLSSLMKLMRFTKIQIS